MALIQCPECYREVSDQSAACPHCGYPIKGGQTSAPSPVITIGNDEPSEKPSNAWKIIAGLVVLALVAAAIYVFNGGGSADKRASDQFNQLVLDEMDLSLSSANARDSFFMTDENDSFGLQMISLGHFIFSGENDPTASVDTPFATRVTITRHEAQTIRQQARTEETLQLIDEYAGKDAATAFIVYNVCNRMSVDKEDILEEFVNDDLYKNVSDDAKQKMDLDPVCEIIDGPDVYVVDMDKGFGQSITLNGEVMDLDGFVTFVDLLLAE